MPRQQPRPSAHVRASMFSDNVLGSVKQSAVKVKAVPQVESACVFACFQSPYQCRIFFQLGGPAAACRQRQHDATQAVVLYHGSRNGQPLECLSGDCRTVRVERRNISAKRAPRKCQGRFRCCRRSARIFFSLVRNNGDFTPVSSLIFHDFSERVSHSFMVVPCHQTILAPSR